MLSDGIERCGNGEGSGSPTRPARGTTAGSFGEPSGGRTDAVRVPEFKVDRDIGILSFFGAAEGIEAPWLPLSRSGVGCVVVSAFNGLACVKNDVAEVLASGWRAPPRLSVPAPEELGWW